MSDSSHFDAAGRSRMVDVGGKPVTERMARASGRVSMQPATLERIRGGRGLSPFAEAAEQKGTVPLTAGTSGTVFKGNVLEVARLAGIMGAKRTAELIPLCHPLPLDAVTVDFSFPDDATLAIEAVVHVTARTGVEMEALTAVSVAALTVYDMCKSLDRRMTIDGICLEEKSGGRSGHFLREQP